MKQLFSLLATLVFIQNTSAQLGPIECMTGNHYLHYQHSLGQKIKPGSKLGWQHIATLIKPYKTDIEKGGIPDEIMNQVYLTYQVHHLFSFKGGLFYTNFGGYLPTFSLQFFMRKKNWTTIVAPRMDFARKNNYEVFALVEFTPSLSQDIKLYTRLQGMSNFNKETHNRSYQQLRVGLTVKDYEVGAGLTLDEYGTLRRLHYNTGVFVRKML